MAFTQADLESATEKLGSLDFTGSELEALASLMTENDGEDEVSGFGFDPTQPNKARSFMVEINGFAQPRRFEPGTPKLTADGIIIIEEGHCY